MFANRFAEAKQEFIDNVFGLEQIYLADLATHPDYQSRGAGTRLVTVGIEEGRKRSVNVTLLAQPTAETFYLGRGFKEVRNISVEAVDGETEFGFNVMAYDFDA